MLVSRLLQMTFTDTEDIIMFQAATRARLRARKCSDGGKMKCGGSPKSRHRAQPSTSQSQSQSQSDTQKGQESMETNANNFC